MLPCLTNDGKVILRTKAHKMSKAPDPALFRRNILDDMIKRGIKYVQVYCFDDIIVKMAYPYFIGFCLKKQANCAAKVVRKVEPDEKVVFICKVGTLPKHESELKLHVAHKKIPFINKTGEKVSPKDNNGIKLEKFVFDVFPFSTNFAIWEVPREEEFSLKNSEEANKETLTTCRNDIYSQHVLWLKKTGASFPTTNSSQIDCEISPLVSYNCEDLAELVNGHTLNESLHIELDNVDHKVKFNGLDLNEYQKQN
jgi:UDP-N-acetylglucosamine/UDP-N-acetylgalactosamine diphosphorylase